MYLYSATNTNIKGQPTTGSGAVDDVAADVSSEDGIM